MYLGRIVESASHATCGRDRATPHKDVSRPFLGRPDAQARRAAHQGRAHHGSVVGLPFLFTLPAATDRCRSEEPVLRSVEKDIMPPVTTPEAGPPRGRYRRTFTDVVLERPFPLLGEGAHHQSPPRTACSTDDAGAEAGCHEPGQVGLIVPHDRPHAIIERRAPGPRWSPPRASAIRSRWRQENRFEQYDISSRAQPWCRATLRFTVPAVAPRAACAGARRAAVAALAATLKAADVEPSPVGFLHSYANPAHEGARRILAAALPGVRLSYPVRSARGARVRALLDDLRHAYVQPLMRAISKACAAASRRRALAARSADDSGGGLTTLETAVRFPIRLVESVRRRRHPVDLDRRALRHRPHPLLRHGRHTAKICIIDDGKPMARAASRSIAAAS